MPQEDKPEPKAPKAELLSPSDWAKRKGHLKSEDVPVNEVLGTGPHYSWQHACADAAHGWSHHAYHYQAEPLLLSEADYMAAIDAACPKEGLPLQHEPARAPHAPKAPKEHAEMAERIRSAKAAKG